MRLLGYLGASEILSCFKLRGKDPRKPKRFSWSVQGSLRGNRNPLRLFFFCQRFLLEKQKKMLCRTCKFAAAGCLRRPYLFRLAGKDRGEKGRLVTFGCFLPLNSGKHQCFGLTFHSVVTSRMSYYAPPDTGVSDLQLVAVEYLP